MNPPVSKPYRPAKDGVSWNISIIFIVAPEGLEGASPLQAAISSQTLFFFVFVTLLINLLCKISMFSSYFSVKTAISDAEKFDFVLFSPRKLFRIKMLLVISWLNKTRN